MFSKLDACLGGFYQATVNFLHVHPHWLARKCVLLMLLVGMVEYVVINPDWLGVFALMTFCAVAVLGTYSKAWMKAIGSQPFFRALTLLILVIDGLTGPSFVGIVSNVCAVSFAYLATCMPPPPKPPRKVFNEAACQS